MRGLTPGCVECHLILDDFRLRANRVVRLTLEFVRYRIIIPIARTFLNVQHVGKIPVRIGEHVRTRQAVARLERALKHAIQEEEYEKAARLRDEIENLEPS